MMRRRERRLAEAKREAAFYRSALGDAKAEVTRLGIENLFMRQRVRDLRARLTADDVDGHREAPLRDIIAELEQIVVTPPRQDGEA